MALCCATARNGSGAERDGIKWGVMWVGWVDGRERKREDIKKEESGLWIGMNWVEGWICRLSLIEFLLITIIDPIYKI